MRSKVVARSALGVVIRRVLKGFGILALVYLICVGVILLMNAGSATREVSIGGTIQQSAESSRGVTVSVATRESKRQKVLRLEPKGLEPWSFVVEKDEFPVTVSLRSVPEGDVLFQKEFRNPNDVPKPLDIKL